MLNPKFVSPFTKAIYDAIVQEMERIEASTNAWTTKTRDRYEVLERWLDLLENDTEVEMTLTKFPYDGPLRL